ncbi:MAG: OB-fold domain-containing protein [Thermodesulfobacteriota bacterium]|nr:OB-fold domain-containing protein [Thermodesulfobacteriota bacterium]
MAERVPVKKGAFLENQEGGVLLANKCQSCGQIFFPKASLCLTCYSEDMKELKLSRRGKLYSYTIGRMPSTHFEPPYAIGYVEMPEGIKVFSPLKMVEERSLSIGMDMEMVLEKLWDEGDKEIIGYKFMPVL